LKNLKLSPLRFGGVSQATILSLFVSLSICFFLAGIAIKNKTSIERLRLEQLAMAQSNHLSAVITKQLYKAYALSALITQSAGQMEGFDRLAPFLLDDRVILNFLLAPGGIVTKVFPQVGNEDLIGFNFFTDAPDNKEALAAIDRGGLTLGGPFTSRQGGRALVGRMPIYLDAETGRPKLWGLVSVTLKLPEVLEAAGFDLLTEQGLSYQLWRTNPDTGERQAIADGPLQPPSASRYIEYNIQILNANWHLKIWPIRAWYNYPENIGLIAASVFMGFLILSVMQNNDHLKQMRDSLELLAQYDQLTGIYNRRHFTEISLINLERSRRLNKACYVIIFDLDRFKDINDTYGHAAGDAVLVHVASHIKALIRPYDVFGRYGGEEFIIAVFDIEANDIVNLVERLRHSLENEKIPYDNMALQVTASFGAAKIADFDLEKAMLCADKALYAAKRGGRNKVAMHPV